jgi:hypothetical protein
MSRPSETEWTVIDLLCVAGLVAFVYALCKGWV